MEQGSYYGDNPIGVATMWDTLGNLKYHGIGSSEKQYSNFYRTPDDIQDYIQAFVGKKERQIRKKCKHVNDLKQCLPINYNTSNKQSSHELRKKKSIKKNQEIAKSFISK